LLHKVLVEKGLLNQKDATKKVVLFLDGYSQPLDLEFSKFCDDHGIILISFPEKSEHILQPIHKLKQTWMQELEQIRVDSGEKTIRANIGEKLASAFRQIIPDDIKEAFR
jgi:hypothetical protein